MNTKNPPDLSTFFLEVEKRALALPVQLIPLTDSHAHHIGLLLYRKDAAESLQAALKKVLSPGEIPSAETSLPAGCGKADDSRTLLPDGQEFQRILAGELDRVGKTRLPCTLILLGIHSPAPVLPESRKALQQLAEIAHSVMGHTGTLASHAADTLALVLPGTNLGKGLYYAGEIMATVQKNQPPSSALGSQIIMGAVVCHAFDNLKPESFLRLGEKELQRARKKGPGSICHFIPRSEENFCQVTVEERAELFRPCG